MTIGGRIQVNCAYTDDDRDQIYQAPADVEDSFPIRSRTSPRCGGKPANRSYGYDGRCRGTGFGECRSSDPVAAGKPARPFMRHRSAIWRPAFPPSSATPCWSAEPEPKNRISSIAMAFARIGGGARERFYTVVDPSSAWRGKPTPAARAASRVSHPHGPRRAR